MTFRNTHATQQRDIRVHTHFTGNIFASIWRYDCNPNVWIRHKVSYYNNNRIGNRPYSPFSTSLHMITRCIKHAPLERFWIHFDMYLNQSKLKSPKYFDPKCILLTTLLKKSRSVLVPKWSQCWADSLRRLSIAEYKVRYLKILW